MQNVATGVAASAKEAHETVAVFKDASARQMRAYLSVGFGNLVKQNPVTNQRFEVHMMLQNVGNTPAYKVASDTHLDVLPFPFPSDFAFPDIVEAMPSANVVGPHHNYVLTGVAERLYSSDDILEISHGAKKRLYVYGRIKYEDAFGTSRHLNFCQAILWLNDDTFMSLNTPSFNDAD